MSICGRVLNVESVCAKVHLCANITIMLAKKKKRTLINKNRTHEKDTGSSQVQVALLNERIKQLTDHLKAHRKDHGSRKGLLQLVARRRSHEKYLSKSSKK